MKPQYTIKAWTALKDNRKVSLVKKKKKSFLTSETKILKEKSIYHQQRKSTKL